MMMYASCKGDVQVWHFKEKLCVGFYHWIFILFFLARSDFFLFDAKYCSFLFSSFMNKSH
jgi:hypothetical protein